MAERSLKAGDRVAHRKGDHPLGVVRGVDALGYALVRWENGAPHSLAHAFWLKRVGLLERLMIRWAYNDDAAVRT